MKQFFPILMFLSLVVGTTEAISQNMVIRMTDGTENQKQVSLLQKFSFSNNNLLLNFSNKTTETYSLSVIRKIYFKTGTTGLGNNSLSFNTKPVSVYPNPAENVLYIQNAPETTFIVSIYRMDGVLMMQCTIPFGEKSINISNLPKGMYILRINNQAIKFIKS